MGQILRQDDISGALSITSTTTAQMFASASAPIIVTLGGRQYRSSSTLTLNTAVSGLGGLDTGSLAAATYYLFLTVSSGTLGLTMSLSSSPTGFSVSKLLGRVIIASDGVSVGKAILAIDTEDGYQNKLASVLQKRNYIINSCFDYWQRNTSFSLNSTVYTSDRHLIGSVSGGGTVATGTTSRQSLTDLSFEQKYYCRVANTSVGSSLGATSYHVWAQRIEDVRALANKIVTVSIWMSSSIPGKQVAVYMGQSFGGGGSPEAAVYNPNSVVTLSGTTTRYDFTFKVPSISSKTIGDDNNHTYVGLLFQAGSTTVSPYGIASPISWGSTGNIDIVRWQLVEGYIPAPHTRAGEDLQGELAKCQRYYSKSYQKDTVPGTATWAGAVSGGVMYPGGNDMAGTAKLPTTMRVIPNIAIYSPSTGSSGLIGRIGGANLSFGGFYINDTNLIVYWNNQGGADDQVEGFHFAVDAEI